MALSEPTLVGVSAYPRAAAAIRRAKSWGGLLGFGITMLAGLSGGATFPTACFRALVAGVAGYLIAWAVSVTIWRQLVRGHARATVERVARARAESS